MAPVGLRTRRRRRNFLNTAAGYQINAATATTGYGLPPFKVVDHIHFFALKITLFKRYDQFSYQEMIENSSQGNYTKYQILHTCQALLDVSYLNYPYKVYENYLHFNLVPDISAPPEPNYYPPYQKLAGPLKRAVENAAATTKATFSKKEVLTRWVLVQQLMPCLENFPERPREDLDYALAGVAHKISERIVYLQDTFQGDIITLLRRFSIVLLDDLFDLVPPSMASLHENYSDKEIASLVDIQPLFLVQDVNDTLKRLEE